MMKLTFIAGFLLISFIGISQTTFIPDANFEQVLINIGRDVGPINGQIPTDSIKNIQSLDVEYSNISDLTGIEDFISVRDLRCGHNPINSLDLSNNQMLWQFYCNYTLLDTLDFSNNDSLTFIDIDHNELKHIVFPTNNIIHQIECAYNQLTSLDVSECTLLKWFSCQHNNITNLDLSNQSKLDWITCGYNLLTSLDLSNNTLLDALNCEHNFITTLDFSAQANLSEVECGNNQIQFLDLSNNSVLEGLECDSNQLTCLNISNGNNTNMDIFNAIGNSQLSCIQVDNVSYSQANWASGVDAGIVFGNCDYASCLSSTAINNVLIGKFNLFPNPSSSTITIHINKEQKNAKWKIIDLLGNIILEGNIDKSKTINIQSLSLGNYLFQIHTTSNIIKSKKIVKI